MKSYHNGDGDDDHNTVGKNVKGQCPGVPGLMLSIHMMVFMIL